MKIKAVLNCVVFIICASCGGDSAKKATGNSYLPELLIHNVPFFDGDFCLEVFPKYVGPDVFRNESGYYPFYHSGDLQMDGYVKIMYLSKDNKLVWFESIGGLASESLIYGPVSVKKLLGIKNERDAYLASYIQKWKENDAK